MINVVRLFYKGENLMTDTEKALEIIVRNEKTIQKRLFIDGYMFDDEFDEEYISSPVARELSSCIKNHFHLEKEQYVIRDEIDSENRSKGVLYFSECSMMFPEVKEIAKQHYEIK